MNSLTIFFAYVALSWVHCLIIDNSIVGTPTITCGVEWISLSISTKNPFFGRVFIKGANNKSECSKMFVNNTNDHKADIKVKFDSCGMLRERKLTPGPGLEQSVMIVVSFHYLFVTKVDKAYFVHCFYGQQDTATVSYGMNISNIPTVHLNGADNMASAECKYEIRKNSLVGPLVQYAEVGDRLYHKWSCNGDVRMLIRNCHVTDGNSEKFLIIDTRGCSVDTIVLPQINYDSNKTSAWVESQAFKFADTTYLTFSCAVRLCSVTKENCDEITPPQCSLAGQGFRLADSPIFDESDDEIDVSSLSINVLEKQFDYQVLSRSDKSLPESYMEENTETYSNEPNQRNSSNSEETLCLTKMYFVILIFIIVATCMTLTLGCLAMYVALKYQKNMPYFKYF